MSSTRDFIASTVADSMLPYIRRPVEDIIYETLDTRQVPNRTDFRELRDLVNSLRGQLSGATGGVRKLAEQLDELSERMDDGTAAADTSAVDQVKDDLAALAGQLERASKVAVQLSAVETRLGALETSHSERLAALEAQVARIANAATASAQPAASTPAATTAAAPSSCKVTECDTKPRAKGFCAKHYQRWRRGTLEGYGAA